MQKISNRLAEIIDALPIKEGMRILEIGCGPGVACREIVRRYKRVHVLGIDRSEKAIQQATSSSAKEINKGRLEFRTTAIERFELEENEQLFDMAFAIRVGALDGRHPEIAAEAIAKIKKALKPNGKCYIDGGDPLKELF